jgi:transaldolase
MKFSLDTADTAEIKSLAASALLDGVSTNPSGIAKSGRRILDVIAEICATGLGRVSALVAAAEYEGMPVAAVPHPLQVVQSAKLGVHVVTLLPPVLRQLFHHPLTDKGLTAFLADWSKTGQQIA